MGTNRRRSTSCASLCLREAMPWRCCRWRIRTALPLRADTMRAVSTSTETRDSTGAPIPKSLRASAVERAGNARFAGIHPELAPGEDRRAALGPRGDRRGWRAIDGAGRSDVESDDGGGASPYRLRVTKWSGPRRLQQTDADCPGSLGQWAGYGLIYPDDSQPAMITLELPYDAAWRRPEELPEDHVDVVRAHWQRDAAGYLATVRVPVFKMLKVACELKLK